MKRSIFILLLFVSCLSIRAQDTLNWQEQLDRLQLDARSFSNQGKFDSAVVVSHQAIRFALKHGGDTSKAYSESLLYQGNNFYYLRSLDSALHYYESAGKAAEGNVDPADGFFGKVWNNMANILSAKAYYDEALEYYIKAAKNKQLSMPPFALSLAKSTLNIGDMYMRKTYMDSALTYYNITDSILKGREKLILEGEIRKGSPAITKAVLYNSLNEYYNLMRDFETSHEYTYRSYLILKDKLGDKHPYVLQATANVGISYKDIGQKEEAISFLKKALSIREELYKEPNTQIVSSHTNLGSCYLAFGETELALEHFKIAIELGEKVFGDRGDLMASIASSLAQVHLQKGNTWEAVSYYQSAIEYIENTYGAHHVKIADYYNKIGDIHASLGLNDVALMLYQYGLYAIDENIDTLNYLTNPSQGALLANTVNSVGLLASKAQVQAGFYDWKNALRTAMLADSLSKEVRGLHLSEESKLRVRETEEANSKTIISAYYHLYQEDQNPIFIEDALTHLSNSKSSLLNQNYHALKGQEILGIPDSLLSKQRSLKNDINSLKKMLFQAEKESENIVRWRAKLAGQKASLKELESLMLEEYPEYGRYLQEGYQFNLSKFQKTLSHDEVLVDYFLVDTILYTLSIYEDKVSFLRANVGSIETEIEQFRRAIDESLYDEFITSSNKLYNLLIEPLSTEEIETIIVVPSSNLFNIPVEALIRELPEKKGSYKLDYLVRHYEIRYYSSSYLIENLSETNTRYNLKFYLGIAPNYNSSNYVNLANSITEVKSAASLFEGKGLVQESATEMAFKEMAMNYKLLHIAAHAEENENNPLYSKIVFSPDSVEDGELHTYELYNMRLHADLAVLSSCNTGSGRLNKGEGLMSLSRGFQFAGVKSLIMTLWQVPDFSSSQIIQNTFELLLENYGKAEALAVAKRNYLKQADGITANPKYWSGYVLYGDNIPIKNTPLWLPPLGVFIFLLLLIAVFNKRRELLKLFS